MEKTQKQKRDMARRARVEELKANDRRLVSGADTKPAAEFAAGVEAGLLWALGDIGDIPFHRV